MELAQKKEEPPYRLKEIEIRRGWAIDQIKFVYSDSKVWSVGIDGGRRDPRKIIMTPGEWLVKVTHENLHQRWYAGTAVTFYTNKGRVFTYKPYMSTGTPGEQITMAAEEGKEIVRLVIRRGCLEGLVEQHVPVEERVEHSDNWYCLVEEDRQEWRITQFCDKKELMEKYDDSYGVHIALDVKNNRILKQKGGRSELKECRNTAIEAGLLVDPSPEEGNIWDLTRIFMGTFSWRKDLVSFTVTLLLLVISNILYGYSHILTGHVLGSLANNTTTSSADNLLLPALICENVVECSDKNGERKAIFVSFFLVLILQSLVNSLQIYVHSMFKDTRLFEMKNHLFSHTLNQEMGFYDTRTTGDILSAMDPTVIVDIIAWEVPYLIADIVKILSSLLFMFAINTKLATSVLVLLVIFKIGILSPIQNGYKKISKMDIKINTMIDQTKSDSITMISSVKLFSKEELHVGEHMEAQLKLKENIMKRNLFRICTIFTMSTFQIVSFLIGLSFILLEDTVISSGDLTGFFLLFRGIHDQFVHISDNYVSIINKLPGAERVIELLDRKTKLLTGPLQPKSLTGKVEFRNVKFTYPSRPGQTVLSDFSLNMSPKKVTAIVGDSGAGKSTVTNLLMRLYDPDSGSIFIDGFNLKELDISHFHKCVAIVNQNPLLFNCSIRDNIAYGASRDVSDEEIFTAAKLANAYGFIMSFRGGFDTLAGTMGAQLSGGQKQRLAIARAAVRNPKILILDEATSSLDAENEELVQEALERLMKDKSILVIAHRLSTIRGADEIVVMKAGAVVERGTHDMLLKEKGHYEKLIRKQVM